jgi:hypothetical protein
MARRKVWLWNMLRTVFERDRKTQLSGVFSGPPKATEGFTVEALERLGYVGVYRWAETSEKKVV